MLSGEWSVLEDGVPCIVMTIDQKVSVTITESKEMIFSAKGTEHTTKAKYVSGQIIIEDEKEKEFFLFVSKSVEAALRYLNDSKIKTKNFSIETNSSDTLVNLGDGKKAKVGFGSSAAIVAATVAAVLNYHGYEIETIKSKEVIFKLGCIAHYLAQGKIGSSFDVAASTYGGVLVYEKPNMKYVIEQINKKLSMKEIVEKRWPLFFAEQIIMPVKFNLNIGFVGYSASTKELIQKLDIYKKERKVEYQILIGKIKLVTQKLILAIKRVQLEEILSLLKQNRILLKQLNDESKNKLETKELTILADIADKLGGAGKFSGAGGGDCGIAISFDKKIKKSIEEKWKEKGIYSIKAKISPTGVIKED